MKSRTCLQEENDGETGACMGEFLTHQLDEDISYGGIGKEVLHIQMRGTDSTQITELKSKIIGPQ